MDDVGASVAGYVALPPGLADMAPGRELGAVLGSLDRRSFNGYQMTVIMAARARQVCWEQAQLLADVHELAHCAPGRHDSAPRRVEAPGSAIADEVSFTLAWTTSAALDQVSMAWAAIDCHPPLYKALAEGILDLAKLKMVLIEVDLMDHDQAAAVIAKILPEAERLTLPQLRQRVRKLVLTIDPELVRKRYRRDLTRRNVSVTDYRNGTSTIVGRYLPTDKVAAAMDFLNATATATIRAGDPGGTPFDQCDRRTAAQIRADVFLDLLAGADPTVPANQGGAGAVNPGPRKGSVHLTIELETLLCLNDHPGELDGFGPVVADIARQVADGLQDVPNWRFVLTDQGRVIHEGRLRYRPTAAQKSYVRARDKYCRAPGCRRPARQCDIDHILAWDDGGVTHEDNLCPLCRRHHTIKHNGYRLYRTDFGLVWITPHGQAHPVSFGHELTDQQRKMLQEFVNRGEAFPIDTVTPRQRP